MMGFFKRETVFCIAFVAALVSSLFNLQPASWIEGIDWRTLALLFCLMATSSALKSGGIFTLVAESLERKAGSTRTLSFLLIAIVFVLSMFFTNDVCLLMFVPFTLMIAERERMDGKTVVNLVVLETIAANLGSMATPVGNPQNIYICSAFSLEAGPFFATILPYVGISALLIAIASILLFRKGVKLESGESEAIALDKRRTAAQLAFLILALLAVFRVLDWRVLLVAEVVYLLAFERKVFRDVDYILLLTFVCFFIFSANMKEIDAVRNLLSGPMEGHPLATSALVSQVISNVPAAILLTPFTENWQAVLVGTDIGGLGTPVASLASLISLKFYFQEKNGSKLRYISVFLILNFLFLAVLALSTLLLV